MKCEQWSNALQLYHTKSEGKLLCDACEHATSDLELIDIFPISSGFLINTNSFVKILTFVAEKVIKTKLNSTST